MSLFWKIFARELAEWLTPFFLLTSWTAIKNLFIFGFMLAMSSMLTGATIKWFYLGGITGITWLWFGGLVVGSLFLVFVTVATGQNVISVLEAYDD